MMINFKAFLLNKFYLFNEINQLFNYVIASIASLKLEHYAFAFTNFAICSLFFYFLFYWHQRSKNKLLHVIFSIILTLGISFCLEYLEIFYSSYSLKLLLIYFVIQVILNQLFEHLRKKNRSQKFISILKFDLYALVNWIFLGESGYYFIPKNTSIEQGFWELFVLGLFVIFVISLLMLRRIIIDTIESKEGVVLKKLLKIVYSSVWLFVCLFILNWISSVPILIKMRRSFESFTIFVSIHFGVWIAKSIFKRTIEANYASKYHNQHWEAYRLLNFLLKMTVNPMIAILVGYVWGIDIVAICLDFCGKVMLQKFFIVVGLLIVLKMLFIFCETIVRFIVDAQHRGKEVSSRFETLITIINIFIKIIIVLLGLFCLLYLLGANPMPLFSHFWLLAAGLSLGLQTLMKDLAVGIIMMFEDTFHIGDDVEVSGVSGEIEEITLRVLKIRSDTDGALVSIPFNKVDIVTNKSRNFVVVTFVVVVDHTSDFTLVAQIMEEAGKNLSKLPEFRKKVLHEIKVFGPLAISAIGARFEAKLKVAPMSMRALRSVYYTLCQQEFEANDIKFAYDVSELKKVFS